MKATCKLSLCIVVLSLGLLGAPPPAMAQWASHTLHGTACTPADRSVPDNVRYEVNGIVARLANTLVVCPVVRFATATMASGLTVKVVGRNLTNCDLYRTLDGVATFASPMGLDAVQPPLPYRRLTSGMLLPGNIPAQSAYSVVCRLNAVGDVITHVEAVE